jgi:hypothetical protein
MADPVSIKAVILPAAIVVKTPESTEQRLTGDCKPLGEQETPLGHEGDGVWRSEVLMDPGTFLQATSQWKMVGPPRDAAKPQPLRSPDQTSTCFFM